jgi:hypothetical protein
MAAVNGAEGWDAELILRPECRFPAPLDPLARLINTQTCVDGLAAHVVRQLNHGDSHTEESLAIVCDQKPPRMPKCTILTTNCCPDSRWNGR